MNDRNHVPKEIEPSLAEVIEGAVRKLVTGIVIAGGLIALGVYWQPTPPRYQGFAAEGRFYRIDTRRGTIIGCENNHCAIVLRHGQELEDALELPALEKHLAPPQPAPAPVPAQVPAPAAAPPPAAAPTPAAPQH
ncbi:MAG: hypothetical protein JO276_15900 [Sphingomonadaceae bacterium]|nr:hypothetical protein [Sphingomonadaceae bacterium]